MNIAIVGMACRYPDAATPAELWENVLAERRAFRRIPDERLRLADYGSPDRLAEDRTYGTGAAVIEGYRFDRLRFRVTGDAYRSADLAHWLALEVAADALHDAGFAEGEGLPRELTGVLVGNSLTGEFSRAGLLRLRWPYVRRVMDAALADEGWSADDRRRFLAGAEARFKAPFPAIGGESLAGGLSNTIAGRICNHFDLGGGGYTVDGACASSLLAVANGCAALAAGELDVVLAGGVDLSLDPFELVGFAKAGALASGEMRVFDARSAGFCPGEGCGMVVMMREDDARGRAVHALIRGWGVSSDGGGGLTRPEADGQLRAYRRAYARAGFGADTVACFEAHGTGTAVGDETELRVIARARAGAAAPAAVGSVKAIIGHTKAAAGVAGLIKAVMAVRARVIPPATGCVEPHPHFAAHPDLLRAPAAAEPWPAGLPLRAGVSAMGFGGINAHVVVEAVDDPRATGLDAHTVTLLRPPQDVERLPAHVVMEAVDGPRATGLDAHTAPPVRSAQDAELLPSHVVVEAADEPRATGLDAHTATLLRVAQHGEHFPAHVVVEAVDAARAAGLDAHTATLVRSVQDAELFPLSAKDARGLEAALERLAARAPSLSRAELADLAAHLQRRDGSGAARAAVVAGTPEALARGLETVLRWLRAGERRRVRPGACLCTAAGSPRIGLLFPGQGAPAHVDGGALRRRFPAVGALYDAHPLPAGDGVATQVAQPAIALASAAALEVLEAVGVDAAVAVGHSLGELAALHWAGAMDRRALQRIAAARGAAVGALDGDAGAMLGVAAPAQEVEAMLDGSGLTVAGINSPRHTVLAGPAAAVDGFAERARARGWTAQRLAVSHAFHSPLVAPAAAALAAHLESEPLLPLARPVASTVTGGLLPPGADLRALLHRQVTAPVRFLDAVRAAGDVDLWLEAGPGHMLTALASTFADAPVIATDAGGTSLAGILNATAAAWTLGAPVRLPALCEDRFTRPFDPDRAPRFFASPCESAPLDGWSTGALTLAKGAAPDVPGGTRAIEPAPSAPASAHADAPRRESASEAARLLAQQEVTGEATASAATFARRAASGGNTSDEAHAAAARREASRADEAATFSRRDASGWNTSDETQIAFAGREASGADEAQIAGEHEASGPSDSRSCESAVEVMRMLVAERAELPAAAIQDDHRLLADLHLNSIAVGEIVARAARRLRLPPPINPTHFASTTVAGAACALEEQDRSGTPVETPSAVPGVGPWVRAFTSELVEAPLPRAAAASAGTHMWRVLAPDGHALAEPLRGALDGDGVAVCLPPDPDERHIALLLEAVQSAPARFLLVQHGGGAASLARTLHLETRTPVCVVDVPPDHPHAVEWIAAEARAANGGYTEAWYDADGRRRIPLLRPAAPPTDGAPLGPGDVLLATGGAKGITAECALALARGTGAHLALIGRSPAAGDPAVAATLVRLAEAGVRARYFEADVTDAAAVRHAVARAEAALGPVTALLHGTGVNTPRLLAELDEAQVRRTLAPKVEGARNVLAALDADRLHLVIGLGSIIARMGLAGAGDYALANEWLARLVERFGADHPACRCITLEYSVWAGTGMGARLGSIDALVRAGVMPIAPEEGAALCRALATSRAASLVVTGRFGAPPTLAVEPAALPLLRFLQTPRVHYPGVELVAEAELSAATDPYLDDHVVEGDRLLPGVMALEAMAQAAAALVGTGGAPVLEDVSFERPIVVPAAGTVTVRVCALVRGPGVVDVVLRSGTTDFAADHVRATCRFAEGAHTETRRHGEEDQEVALDAAALYGGLFFHRGRFRRVAGYRRLAARGCEAGIGAAEGVRWFGAFLPPALLLGDPGARDAAIHAVQACIPHVRVLPVGVRRVAASALDPAAAHTVRAKEVSDDGRELVWDLEIADAEGVVRERWEGLRLRRVGTLAPAQGWEPALLAPYLERRVAECVPGAALSVALERRADGDRASRGDQAIRRAAGVRVTVRRAPDGRPEVVDVPLAVSASHAGDLTLAVAGAAPLGCDIEPVTPRPPRLWRDLLGDGGWALAALVSRETGEPIDTAATRVWSAREALIKTGLPATSPLVLTRAEAGWVMVEAAGRAAATCVVTVAGMAGEQVVAVAAGTAVHAARASATVPQEAAW